MKLACERLRAVALAAVIIVLAQTFQACNLNSTTSDPTPTSPSSVSAQTWDLNLAGGAPLAAGAPNERVTVNVPSGITSSIFNVTSGQWYVLDRLNNVVPIRFTTTFVSNDWSFTGTGGPSPDGLTVQVNGSGTANGSYASATAVSGSVTLNYMEPGLPAVRQSANWTGTKR